MCWPRSDSPRLWCLNHTLAGSITVALAKDGLSMCRSASYEPGHAVHLRIPAQLRRVIAGSQFPGSLGSSRPVTDMGREDLYPARAHRMYWAVSTGRSE